MRIAPNRWTAPMIWRRRSPSALSSQGVRLRIRGAHPMQVTIMRQSLHVIIARHDAGGEGEEDRAGLRRIERALRQRANAKLTAFQAARMWRVRVCPANHALCLRPFRRFRWAKAPGRCKGPRASPAFHNKRRNVGHHSIPQTTKTSAGLRTASRINHADPNDTRNSGPHGELKMCGDGVWPRRSDPDVGRSGCAIGIG
jgi:hypothetical protein